MIELQFHAVLAIVDSVLAGQVKSHVVEVVGLLVAQFISHVQERFLYVRIVDVHHGRVVCQAHRGVCDVVVVDELERNSVAFDSTGFVDVDGRLAITVQAVVVRGPRSAVARVIDGCHS